MGSGMGLSNNGIACVLFLFCAHLVVYMNWFFFSSRRRHTRWNCDWSSDVCSSDLGDGVTIAGTDFRAGLTVLFGTTPSPKVALNDAGSLTAVVPDIAAGPVLVVGG